MYAKSSIRARNKKRKKLPCLIGWRKSAMCTIVIDAAIGCRRHYTQLRLSAAQFKWSLRQKIGNKYVEFFLKQLITLYVPISNPDATLSKCAARILRYSPPVTFYIYNILLIWISWYRRLDPATSRPKKKGGAEWTKERIEEALHLLLGIIVSQGDSSLFPIFHLFWLSKSIWKVTRAVQSTWG
jgi:hypothetical protein